MELISQIQEWHKTAQAGSPLKDELVSVKLDQAINLIKEEVEEMIEAAESGDKDHAAHEAADVIFVAVNLLHVLGYDAESVVREVTKANYEKIFNAQTVVDMSLEIIDYCEEKEANIRKCGEELYAIYGESGKMKKGPFYEKPDYSKFEKVQDGIYST